MKIMDIITKPGLGIQVSINGKILMFVKGKWHVYDRKEYPRTKSLLLKTEDEEKAVELLVEGHI